MLLAREATDGAGSAEASGGSRPAGAGRTGASDFLVWQLADSAFPSGGFAHSGGLEAAWHHGAVRSAMELESYVSASLDQAASGSLPLVVAAHDAAGDGGRLGEIDELCDAFTSNHVANRASRLQGRAFHAAAVKLLPPGETVGPWPCGHLAPVFGAVLRRLGVDVEAAARLFVFHHVRGLLAAAVRLNIIGPMQAQVLQHRWQPRLATAASRARHRSVEDLAQTAPLLDLWQAAQDRLYSRLFQS